MRSFSAFETRAWTRASLVWMVSSALVGLVACGGSDEDSTPDGSPDAGDGGGGDVNIDTTPDPGCESTCEEDGGFVCDGTTHRLLCRDYNGDGCLETGDRTPCGSGTACEAGVCVNSNTPPTPGVLEFTTPEDTALTVTIDADDPDAENLRFDVTGLPDHGTISGRVPEITYTPNADFVGTDEITFTVTDRLSPPVEGRVTITVTAVNDAPQAAGSSISVNEDSSAAFEVPGSDIDGDALTWELVTAPSHGTLEGSGPSYSYTPEADYFGPDVVQVRVIDAAGAASDPAAVTLNVLPTNDGPVAQEGSGALDEDDALALQLRGTDIDSDRLSYTIASQPAHGSLVGDGDAWTYIPDDNFNGTDGFTFTVSDGELTSAPASWTLTVAPVQDAPVVQPLVLQTNEDTERAITLVATDIDDDALTFSVVTFPEHGELEGSGASWTYRPAGDYFGPDAFTYEVTDGETLPVQATATITVRSVNDLPQGTTPPVTVQQDFNVAFTLTGSDVEEDALQFLVTGLPARGTLSGTAPNLTYTPETGFSGSDSMRYRVSDGLGTSNEITLPITVTPNAAAPRVLSTDFVGTEDATSAIFLRGEDDDTPADLLTWTVQTQPGNGTLTGTAPSLTYLPNENFAGEDSFEVRLSDGSLDSGNVTIRITVSPVNDAPISGFVTYQLDEDTSLDFELFGVEPDGDAMTWIVTTPPSRGTLTGTGASRTFTPPANVFGNFTVGYRISDGVLQSIPGLITLEVQPINDPPVIDPITPEFDEDTIGEFQLTAFDVEDDVVEFFIVDDSSVPGTVTLSPEGDLTIEPDPDFFGEFALEVGATDGTDSAQVERFSVIVRSVNDAPTLQPATFTTDEDQPVNLTFVVDDVEGNAISFEPVRNPELGTLFDVEGSLRYIPRPNVSGTDTFEIRATDGRAASGPVTMTVIIRAVNDPPTANADTIGYLGNTPATYPAGALTANDSDVEDDGVSAVAEIVETANGGTVEIFADGSFMLTPAVGRDAEDSFSYSVVDTNGSEALGTVTLQNRRTVWYVDSEVDLDAISDGTLGSPFRLLADAEVVSGPGDVVLLRDRSTFYEAGIALKDNQKLISETLGLAFPWNAAGDTIEIFPASINRPLATIVVGESVPAQQEFPIETDFGGSSGVVLANNNVVEAVNFVSVDPFSTGITGEGTQGATLRQLSFFGGRHGIALSVFASNIDISEIVALSSRQAAVSLQFFTSVETFGATVPESSVRIAASQFGGESLTLGGGVIVDIGNEAALMLDLDANTYEGLGSAGVQVLAAGTSFADVRVNGGSFRSIDVRGVSATTWDSAELWLTLADATNTLEGATCEFDSTQGALSVMSEGNVRPVVAVEGCSFSNTTGDGEFSFAPSIRLGGAVSAEIEGSTFVNQLQEVILIAETFSGTTDVRVAGNRFEDLSSDGVVAYLPYEGTTLRVELFDNIFEAVLGTSFRTKLGEGSPLTAGTAEFDFRLLANQLSTGEESPQVQVSLFGEQNWDGCIAMSDNSLGRYDLLNETASPVGVESNELDVNAGLELMNAIASAAGSSAFGFSALPLNSCDFVSVGPQD